jgi:hypothetical protein
MASIDIFYQGEGLREIEHIVLDDNQTFGNLKTILVKKHGLESAVFFFLEDADEPIGENSILGEHAGAAGIKTHLHRCHKIDVSVTFNGKTVQHRFAPGATVARVKRWAAEEKFGMTAEEVSEHVLQIAGTQNRPTPGTHIGALTSAPNCKVAFDLVPDQRVNGAPRAEG